jgi:hypothetical protein
VRRWRREEGGHPRRMGGLQANVGMSRGEGEWDRSKKHSAIFIFIQKVFKRTKLIWSKEVLPVLYKFQIKYGFKYFEVRNNFPYWNLSNFEIEFELKIRKASRVCIWIEFDEILIWTPGFDDVKNQTPVCTQMKDRSWKEVQIFKFASFLDSLLEFD